MAVVTVARQYGAGGSRVAELTARALGWTLIDNEFVQEVARRAGLPAEEVEARQERAPSLLTRLARALATASPEVFVPAAVDAEGPAEEQIVRITERIITDAVQEGSVVVVGRAAPFVLGSAWPEWALHTYIVAPREVRLRTIAARLGVDEDEAARTTDRTDADRDRYVERWYGRHRQDPANYHLVLNTAWLGYDGAAETIVQALKRRGWA